MTALMSLNNLTMTDTSFRYAQLPILFTNFLDSNCAVNLF